ncbi:MAG TPA: hypothetical protein VGL09_03225 [Methylomirabilota bacterium]|jgi:hypothetical protein
MNGFKTATAIFTAATVVAVSGGAFAQSKTPAQADFDACNKEAQSSSSASAAPGSRAGGASPSSRSSTSGSMSSGSGSSASDAQLRGMASAGQNDSAYQQAYRDCMKQRGF